MGFRPVDDSDLESKKDTRRSDVRQTADDKKAVSKGKKKKKKTVFSYIWTFLIVFGSTLGVFIIAVGILLYCAMSGLFGSIGEINLEDFSVNEQSVVYFVDSKTGKFIVDPQTGEPIKEPLSDRLWVDIENINDDLKDAFVAIEDERFYKHSGFDIFRTTKATAMYAWGKVTGGGSDFGGSTITQQLVKNVTGNWETTPTRKVKEISQAVNLEKQLTKDEILELYLNVINLSNGCHGVQEASMKLFGKTANELSLAECASIAGITQNPSYYDPLINPKNNKAKQEIVLKKMLELGFITKTEYNEAVKEKLVFREKDETDDEDGVDDYYIEYLVDELTQEFVNMGYTRELARRKVMSGGLEIWATIDPDVQKAIDVVYKDSATAASIFGYAEGEEKTPQSAMVIVDARSGAIVGMTGGLGKKTANLVYNRATLPKQPGSSIKPIAVYAPAIEDGTIHASTVYSDVPEKGWNIRNSYNNDSSDKPVWLAIQRSSNVIAYRTLRDFGIDKSYNHLKKRLGITSLAESDAEGLSPLALGGMTNGISPVEMAAAYTTFTNKGVYTKPYIYTKVYDKSGKLLIDNKPRTNQAISAQTAYIMTQLLQRVVTSGTGTLAGLDNGVFAAGKTGTTDDNRDKWFVGFTPNYVCAIWHGYDIPAPVPAAYRSGSQRAFKAVMTKVHNGLGSGELNSISKPSGVTMISVCKESGELAVDGCETISLTYADDNKPKKNCKIHDRELDGEGNEIINLDEEIETEE